MAESETAVFRIHINGSIEDVWHQVTKSDEPQECFFNSWMDSNGLAIGATVCMRSKSKKTTGVVGRVLEFDPPRRYAQTFRFTHFNDPECIVCYDLAEKEGGVEFTLTLKDLPIGTKTAKQMRQGANMILNTLKNMVERGRPSLGTRMLFVLFGAMEIMSPKAARSENWPLEEAT